MRTEISRRTINVGQRSGIYTMRCTKCKTYLVRDVDSDWSSIWWWTKLDVGVWEYKEHTDDDGLLDLRGFKCECTGDTTPLYWIWNKQREKAKYFTCRVEGDERSIDYVVQQLNAFAEEHGWKVKIG